MQVRLEHCLFASSLKEMRFVALEKGQAVLRRPTPAAASKSRNGIPRFCRALAICRPPIPPPMMQTLGPANSKTTLSNLTVLVERKRQVPQQVHGRIRACSHARDDSSRPQVD